MGLLFKTMVLIVVVEGDDDDDDVTAATVCGDVECSGDGGGP